jgi:UDP-glucose 4-epimerase
VATLVTGGTGMLGSAIVRRIIKDEGEAVVLDAVDAPYFLNGRGVDLSKVSLAIGDIADASLVAHTLDKYKVDKVIHLAAAVSSVCNRDPLSATRTNCDAVVVLLEACLARDIRRVVMASSVAVYAAQDAYRQDELPITESALMGLSPGSPLYSAGKIYVEAAGHWYRDHHGMEIAGIRPSFIASAGRPSRPPLGVISGEYIDAPACGRPTRVESGNGLVPYVYIEDVVEQFTTLLHAPNDKLGAGPFFNTGGTTYSVGQIVDTVRRIIPDAQIDIGDGTGTDLIFGMPTEVTDDRFVKTFGVSHRYDLEKGVQAQIDEARRWPGLFAESAA